MGSFDLQNIQQLITKMNYDGWLLYDFRKSNPVAHRVLEFPTEAVLTRRIYYLIPAKGNPIKIVNAIEAKNLDHLPGDKKVYSTYQSLHSQLSDALEGLSNVAMEYSPMNNIPYVACVDAGTIELIKSFGVNIQSSGDLITMMDARWTDTQYRENIPVANRLTDIVKLAFYFIKQKITADEPLTEYAVQQFILKEFTKSNFYTDHAPLVAVNGNAANPHYIPTKEIHSPIKKGDTVLFDIWAKLNKEDAVWSDISWVGYVGETVPDKIAKIAQIVFDARDAAFNLVEQRFDEGKEVRGYEVDDAARQVITDAGYGDHFIHRTGHSIATDCHGAGAHMDNFETSDERLIIPSTSFSLEPGIYLPGELGIRSEIDVFITEQGEVLQTGGKRQTEVVAILG